MKTKISTLAIQLLFTNPTQREFTKHLLKCYISDYDIDTAGTQIAGSPVKVLRPGDCPQDLIARGGFWSGEAKATAMEEVDAKRLSAFAKLVQVATQQGLEVHVIDLGFYAPGGLIWVGTLDNCLATLENLQSVYLKNRGFAKVT